MGAHPRCHFSTLEDGWELEAGLGVVPSCFPLCDKTLTKSNIGRKEFIWLKHLGHGLSPWEVKTVSQSRNLEAGTGGEPWRSAVHWLAHSGPPAQTCLSPYWARPSYIDHQSRECSIDLPIGQSDGDICSIALSFFFF